MKLGIRGRIACFGAAIVLVSLAIAWAACTTWKEARQLNERLVKVQVESFAIADHFQAILLQLNSNLGRYQVTRDPADWLEFVRESNALNEWIDEKMKVLTNPEERSVLDRINHAYDQYTDDAHSLTNQAEASKGASSALLRHAETQAQHLFALGNDLANAHRKVVDDLVSSTRSSLPFLLQLIFGLLLVLLALGAWLATVVYRDMIAPLRVKLIETHALIERQEKLASLGVLAAGVAHEIRNPLTAIKARLFTQQKRLSAGSPEAEDAQVINAEINRLERIVRDVLQFARPAEPKRAPISADRPLHEVQKLMAPQLEKRGVALRIQSTVPAQIEVDLQQIEQVLINLVQNAADSIGENGTISLRVRTGTANLQGSSQPVAILEVEDTGKGIAPDVEKRLFDPFFTTKDTGTGLGLAIAARIAEKHGGLLEFQTQINRGTVFGIVLPRCRPHENSSKNSPG